MLPCSFMLAAGQTQARALAAGDELFCADGTLQLQTSAVAGIEALPGLALRLHAGQSWRAPAALLVHITAVNAPARMRCTPAPAALPLPAPPAAPWRARMGAWFKGRRTLGA
ncbi:hypothetical protein [Comamonas endophytica]|uniref:Uncharacterized protein n=1 Tax=Comamonas endophytica TaxID=2949090 RepID=A0ABY6GA94_9BURK|nr:MULTISPECIES: hypothetical protein [unclassified Acidovorax]MCD2512221.1 hypothetical protein [Acidovorax sp. D4N7]UYG51989.1 hypothetical protein M9799_01705 [Acidovorax sp. 5MLIR]